MGFHSLPIAQAQNAVWYMAIWTVALPISIVALLYAFRAVVRRDNQSRRTARSLAIISVGFCAICTFIYIYREARQAANPQGIIVPRSNALFGLLLLGCGPQFLICSAAYLVLQQYDRHPLRSDTIPRCRKCGYNLTGLTEARCPECFTPFDPEQLDPKH